MMRLSKLPRTFALASALLVLPLAACGGEDEGGETTSVRGSGRKATKTTPTTPAGKPTTPGTTSTSTSGGAGLAIPEAGPFTYKPGARSTSSRRRSTSTTAAPTVPLTELQKHELSKFKLTAVVTGTVQPAAVILGPNGKPHFIKRGTLIGPPRGRVAQILSDRVVVEREFKDRLERIHKLKSELRLRADEEELKQ